MANKKGPLSKVETFYVDAQVKLGKPVEEIATDLNRPQSSVESYIAKASKGKKSPMSAGEHFVHQGGATIMTENASTIIDAKRRVPKTNTRDCVTKIKSDE